MKVRAKSIGIHEGTRVRVGAVIEIPDDVPLASWMEPADGAAPINVQKKEPATFSELNQELNRLENRKGW